MSRSRPPVCTRQPRQKTRADWRWATHRWSHSPAQHPGHRRRRLSAQLRRPASCCRGRLRAPRSGPVAAAACLLGLVGGTWPCTLAYAGDPSLVAACSMSTSLRRLVVVSRELFPGLHLWSPAAPLRCSLPSCLAAAAHGLARAGFSEVLDPSRREEEKQDRGERSQRWGKSNCCALYLRNDGLRKQVSYKCLVDMAGWTLAMETNGLKIAL